MYYNIFLEKHSYKDKWIFVYHKCYYDRIVVSEGIDVNKKSASNECDISRY